MVIATDLRPERVDLAKSLGVQQPIYGGSSLKEQVMAATDGKGADCVIIAAAAKSSAPCKLALDICRDRGRIVVIGAVEMEFPWNDMYLKEIQLFMARAYGPGSYDAVVREARARLSVCLCPLDRESQHGGISAAGGPRRCSA